MDKLSFLSSVSDFFDQFDLTVEVCNYIACQCALESNFGQSELSAPSRCCNFFGMKYPKKRPTTSIGESQFGYAIYDSFESCCYDYLLWLSYFGFNRSSDVSSFKSFLLSSSYCPESDYLSRIDSIYNQYFISPKFN